MCGIMIYDTFKNVSYKLLLLNKRVKLLTIVVEKVDQIFSFTSAEIE